MRAVVLEGGRSSEHDVSLRSAAAIAAGLRDRGHEVEVVHLAKDGSWAHHDRPLALAPGSGLLGADVVVSGLHGAFAEDGTVQGLLELLDVPYTGSGVLASAVCLDKIMFKDLMAAHGVPQVRYAGVWQDGPLPDITGFRLPLWVKPARMGSSVGIARVEDESELAAAVAEAFGHDDRVVVEESAAGIEVECSALGPVDAPEISTPGEIVLTGGESGWYDYEAKYTEGGMRLEVPARISGTATARLKEIAAQAFTAAACSGYARIDFFVDGETVLLNEINTLPGQTETSVYSALWAHDGVGYGELLERICEIAIQRHQRERALTL
ncbi:MAG: D-alanine--D-alanine ligase family protein [Baekduia sp.]